MKTHPLPNRILSISQNTRITQTGPNLHIERMQDEVVRLEFPIGCAFVLRQEAGGWYVLPSDSEHAALDGDSLAWVLPLREDDPAPAWLVKAPAGSPISLQIGKAIQIQVQAGKVELRPFENRPRADVFGKRYSFQIEDGARLERALAAFYWDTLLPCVVERTRAAQYATPDGYVLSTLSSNYGGTYPDVDHEFQIKGRLSAGSPLDADVVRRMMELQFKLMREDPLGQWRNPCAIQSDGSREYHVRRSSLDGSTTATMFLITGNVEILEEAWLYTAATKDRAWLAEHIHDLEGAAGEIEANIDPQGRVWSDVYYEDQVMQDGRVCDAQAFAANGFRMLAELEEALGRKEQAESYLARSQQLARALVEPLPQGYWDAAKQRFTNWVDRQGTAHDHVHLLSNELPVLFGCASPEQARSVLRLIDENLEAFQRFPSFVALDLAGYTDSEIGDGGPYDLCAAGRYWCWDAAFWAWRKDNHRLHSQLLQVAREAEAEEFIMGERYDMDHVFYVDGRNWHGSAYYYEYPCVFHWVLVHEYLGFQFALDVDQVIAPHIQGWGRVEYGDSAYTCAPECFTLQNLADAPRTFRLDLSAVYPDARSLRITLGGSEMPYADGGRIQLLPGQACTIQPAAR